jgi:hypothetical protein
VEFIPFTGVRKEGLIGPSSMLRHPVLFHHGDERGRQLYSGPTGLQKERSLVFTTRFVNLKRVPGYFTIPRVYDNCYTYSSSI